MSIPVYNEAEEPGGPRTREIGEVAPANGYELDVIFVDDGSTRRFLGGDPPAGRRRPRVRGIRFRRNFGKAAALSAGFAQARGEMVMTLDADLQDDPHEIPRFLAEMENDLDVVSGWKQVRHDPWHKVLPSRVFNWMVSRLTGVKLHDHNCGMKCYRREVLRRGAALRRAAPLRAGAGGRPRDSASARWSSTTARGSSAARSTASRRFVKGFLDLLTVKFLTGFGQRPQHLLGSDRPGVVSCWAALG